MATTWELDMLVLVLGILGLVVGSFIAVLAVRWPHGRSVASGRSRCDGCGRPLSPIELVPILSALTLGHRCRTCGAPIPALHWRLEAFAALIGIAVALSAPPEQAMTGAVFGWLLLALAATDLTAMLLPDPLTAALALSGIGVGLIGAPPQLAERIIGGMAGFIALWTVRTLYRALRGREGLGGGDPKLLGAIGCWMGWRALPAIVFGASLLGLAYVLVERIAGNRLGADHRLPFGAALAAAAFAAWMASVTAMSI